MDNVYAISLWISKSKSTLCHIRTIPDNLEYSIILKEEEKDGKIKKGRIAVIFFFNYYYYYF
jgi:hypothetical protein